MKKDEALAEAKTASPTTADLLRTLLNGPLTTWDTRKTVQANRRGYVRVQKDELRLTALGRQIANLL